MIAGIDYSTRAVDVVLLDEDSDAATWHRFPLEGADAFDRVRSVRESMRVPYPGLTDKWDSVIAFGIEEPRGYNAGALYRIQGAILSCLPTRTLVHPIGPSEWRKTVGLPGNASKGHVKLQVDAIRLRDAAYIDHRGVQMVPELDNWPQDACDAYCIALATRILLERVPA
jgi:hypothetical protein